MSITMKEFEDNARMIKIISCSDCPKCYLSFRGRSCELVKEMLPEFTTSDMTGRVIDNIFAPIPEWCPLQRISKPWCFRGLAFPNQRIGDEEGACSNCQWLEECKAPTVNQAIRSKDREGLR